MEVFMHPCTFWYSRFSGITRYLCELTNELMKMDVNVHIPIKDTPNEYLKNAGFFPKPLRKRPASRSQRAW